MLVKKYNSIMEKSEDSRNRWALGLTITLSLMIFVSFAFYKGYLSFGNNNAIAAQKSSGQTASVVAAKSVPSPIQNTEETFKAAFDELNQQYQKFTDSVSSVLVPFVTGIEVYKRQ
jgi:hypothetical protein